MPLDHLSSWALYTRPINASLEKAMVKVAIAKLFLLTASSAFLCAIVSAALVVGIAETGGELPSQIKDFTKLAPLGPSSSNSSDAKTIGLVQPGGSVNERFDCRCHWKGELHYYGDLSDDLFRNDCVFQDPTNRVRSLSQYKKALGILFDAEHSVVQLLEPLQINAKDCTIAGTFRSRGFLKLPWKPYVKAYESAILYRIDDDGLVYEQEQHWSISSAEALRESFTPSLFSPSPKSTLLVPVNEPAEVTALFEACNGRRPDEYSRAERQEISTLVQTIQGAHYPWQGQYLPGKWKLVYLEPGPEGAGVDRRIPFPEFPFNDQYQIFTTKDVTNVGELFGPRLFAQVSGTLLEEDVNDKATPKSFRVDIQGGKLCFQTTCAPLPIQGMGLFDILYLGERVRLLQNNNGGGARGVQIKMG